MTNKPITLENFINNPSNSRTIPQSVYSDLRALYTLKFANVIRASRNSIKLKFSKPDDNIVFIYETIPSETIKNFTYDVVFKFTAKSEDQQKQTLDKWFFQIYVNDPAFCYTFAYAFNKNNLLIPECISLYDEEFISDKPKITNPNLTLNYSKIVFFGYLYLKSHGFLKLKNLENTIDKINLKELINSLVPASKKIAERLEAGKSNIRKKNAVRKTTGSSTAKKLEGGSNKTSRRTKYSKSTNSIKHTKTVKRK